MRGCAPVDDEGLGVWRNGVEYDGEGIAQTCVCIRHPEDCFKNFYRFASITTRVVDYT